VIVCSVMPRPAIPSSGAAGPKLDCYPEKM
jgi:hypothetical protein